MAKVLKSIMLPSKMCGLHHVQFWVGVLLFGGTRLTGFFDLNRGSRYKIRSCLSVASGKGCKDVSPHGVVYILNFRDRPEPDIIKGDVVRATV